MNPSQMSDGTVPSTRRRRQGQKNPEGSGWVVEAHDVCVPCRDVQVVVWTERNADRNVEVAARVREQVDECAGRRVVATDPKMASEGASRDV